MIKVFMIATTTLLTLFVAIGLMLSNEYIIKSSVTINAPLAKVHALVGDLNQWSKWSPWSATGVKTNIIQAKGVGAIQTWVSSQGEGSLKFTQSDENRGIVYELLFDKKQYKTLGEFTYKSYGETTELIWSMQGKIDTFVVGGYVAFLTEFMSIDMLDSGLFKIKALAEK